MVTELEIASFLVSFSFFFFLLTFSGIYAGTYQIEAVSSACNGIREELNDSMPHKRALFAVDVEVYGILSVQC